MSSPSAPPAQRACGPTPAWPGPPAPARKARLLGAGPRCAAQRLLAQTPAAWYACPAQALDAQGPAPLSHCFEPSSSTHSLQAQLLHQACIASAPAQTRLLQGTTCSI
ncbi:unnamed protein product [Prunus armeniaca]